MVEIIHLQLLLTTFSAWIGRLDQMIFLGQESLDRAITEHVIHYHDERSHQGIGNESVSGTKARSEGIVDVTERLGGLLNYYHRRAA